MASVSIGKLLLAALPRPLKQHWMRIEASPLGSRLARGVFWSVAGAVISRVLMFAATVVVARLLGKTAYGELGIMQSTVGMFGIFAGLGMGLTATKYVAEFRTKDPERAGNIIALSGVVALITGGLMASAVFVFAPWLAEHTINAPHLTSLIRIGALVLFFSALNGAQSGALSGFEAFKTIAQVNFFTGLTSFPVVVAGAFLGGVTGAALGMVVNLLLGWFFNHLALRKESRRHKVTVRYKNCGKEWPVVWKFSLPAVLAGSMTGPINWVCGALLVNQPNGYAEMGIFSAVNQCFGILLFLPSLLGNVMLPVLSDQIARKHSGQSVKTVILAIRINLLVVIPPAILGAIASPFIMNLYGDSFRDGWPTLLVTLSTAVLVTTSAPVGHILAAAGRMWIGLVMNAGWALVFLSGTLLLISHGSLGLATARGIAYLLHSAWVIAFVILLFKNTRRFSYSVGCDSKAYP